MASHTATREKEIYKVTIIGSIVNLVLLPTSTFTWSRKNRFYKCFCFCFSLLLRFFLLNLLRGKFSQKHIKAHCAA